MKLIKKVMIFILILILPLCSCDNISDMEFALNTEALFSIFGCYGNTLRGYSIIEEDKYNRVLFKIYSGQDANIFVTEKTEDIFNFKYYLICQYIDYENEYIYYYPSVNMNMKYKSDLNEEELKELKELNDWDQEIDLSKCIRRKIGLDFKTNIDTSHINQLAKENINNAKSYYISSCLFDIDKNGLELYAVSFSDLNANDQTKRAFAIISSPKYSFKFDILELHSIDYIDYLEDFKEKNNWEYNFINEINNY